LHCPIKERTKAKKWVVLKADVLRKYRDWNPAIIDGLVDMAHYDKLLDFPIGLLALQHPDGRVRSNFNQAGHVEENTRGASAAAPDTGRLSSSGPNLQNIPHHSDEEWGARLRNCFIPRPGWVWVSCDVEQEEPRIIAHLTQDPALLRAIGDGRDIYRPATEALYEHTRRSDLNDNEWKQRFTHERYVGKTFVLAWWYGAGTHRLRELDSSLTGAVAKRGMERLEATRPTRAAFVADIAEEAERCGYVVDMFGRIKYVPEALNPQPKIRHDGVKKAANFKMGQGPAASILKLALVTQDIEIKREGMQAEIVSTVHDEVNYQAPADEVDTLKAIVYRSFQGYISVPLPVTTSVGPSWGEAE